MDGGSPTAAHPTAEPRGLAPSSRVPGSEGAEAGTRALRLPGSAVAGWAKGEASFGTGHQIGTLHKVTAMSLALWAPSVMEAWGHPGWGLPVSWQGVVWGGGELTQ